MGALNGIVENGWTNHILFEQFRFVDFQFLHVRHNLVQTTIVFRLVDAGVCGFDTDDTR